MRLHPVLRSSGVGRLPTEARPSHVFDSHAEAKGWHQDAVIALRRGHQVKGKSSATLRAVCEDFLAQAGAGAVLNRSGDPYKPSAIRSYERTLRKHVWPTLGEEPVLRHLACGPPAVG